MNNLNTKVEQRELSLSEIILVAGGTDTNEEKRKALEEAERIRHAQALTPHHGEGGNGGGNPCLQCHTPHTQKTTGGNSESAVTLNPITLGPISIDTRKVINSIVNGKPGDWNKWDAKPRG